VTRLEVDHVPIEGRSSQRSWFDGLPAQVYRDDPRWSPASATIAAQTFAAAAAGDGQMHPVVVLRSGSPVARAAGILPPRGPGDPAEGPQGWIGLVECMPQEVNAGRLAITDCRTWLQAQGCREVVAPRTSPLMSGLLVAGFDRPQVILTPYNPPWYAQLLAACGFQQTSSMVALEFTRARVPRFVGSTDPRVRVRHLDTGRLQEELETIRLFQQDVFAGSPGHLDRTPEQMQHLVAGLGAGLDPDLVIIAEDRSGQTIGALICLADVWQPRPPGADPDRARLLTIGVAPGWRGRGVAVAMGRALAGILLQKGYRTLEGSWVLRDNRRPQALARALGARETRRFALLTWHAQGRHAE
jgi:ribosomal protein S18 acetylase RimI-like enzyme